MNINKIKNFDTYYLINDSIYVPNDKSNKDYNFVKKWIKNGNHVENDKLELKKEELKKKITSKRVQLSESSTVDYKNNKYSNSQNARLSIILKMTLLLSNEDTDTYITSGSDKKIVTLSKSDFQAIMNLINEQENNYRLLENTKYSEIDAAKNLKELEKINKQIEKIGI